MPSKTTAEPSPVKAAEDAIAALTAAVDALPFSGHDQRVRAQEGIAAVRHHLLACQLEET